IESCWITARDPNAATPWLVEPGHQMQRGCFASPGASHEGHVFAARYFERNPVQDGLAFGVAKLHATQHDRPRPDLEAVAGGHGPRSLWRQRECAEDAFGTGHRALHGLPLLAQRRNRLEEALHEKEERRQGAEGDAECRERLLRPGPQQRRDRERREDRGHRRIDGGEERRTVGRGQAATEYLTKPRHELRHAPEGPNHLGAPEILLEASVDRSHG